MEQAVLANHGILQPHLTNAPPSIGTSGPGPQGGGPAGDANAHFYFDDDPDIGELGEADVDCDFGDFGFWTLVVPKYSKFKWRFEVASTS